MLSIYLLLQPFYNLGMTTKTFPVDRLPSMSELNRMLAPYQKSDTRRAIGQLANSLIPYLVLWALMILSLKVSYLLTLPLILLAAGFLVRIFIIFHDCGHNSFFPSKKANKIVGFWLGVLTFTPSEHWWHTHAVHHATSSNLDKRGTGDVTMWTIDEYMEGRWVDKLGYRFFRNPFIMFVLGPIFMFFIMHRLYTPKTGKKGLRSVIWTNLALLGLAVAISLAFGWQAYVLIQLPVMMIAGMGGIWLFYVQHQFEDSYWEHDEKWNYVASALLGASYFRLPKVLQWFSGNIGFHHIHHLSPRIPNYKLEECHNNTPTIQQWARPITLKESVDATRLKLWDDGLKRMIGFPRRKVELPNLAPTLATVKEEQRPTDRGSL